MLKHLPVTKLIPFPTEEQAKDVFNRIGTRGIIKNNLQPVIDCIKENRCHEDYDARMSNPKIDFYRKWYHSRARTKVVSLDAIIENSNIQSEGNGEDYYNILEQVWDYSKISFEGTAIYKMDLERYLNLLNDKDTQIFTLKYNGYTQKEIAERLGYRTHSAVGKRINNHIKQVYRNYFDWMPDLK